MAAKTRAGAFAVAVLVLVSVALALTLAVARFSDPDAAVSGVTQDDYPRVGIRTDKTPRLGGTPPCQDAADGSIVARPFEAERRPSWQPEPDSYAPPAPKVPWSERQDCPSL